MPTKAPTTFVPPDSGGMYTPPERSFDRMRAITAHLQPVNGDGHDRARKTPDPSVAETVTPTGPPPTMAEALTLAANAVGADLPTLLDSQAFRTAVTPISPNDQAELQAVIREFQPAPAAPGMKPNLAQGAPSGIAPGPVTGSVLDQIRAQLVAKADQPEPPGSTYYR